MGNESRERSSFSGPINEGLSEREMVLISIFVAIRSLPYRFPLSADEKNLTSYGKHGVLKIRLERMKMEVRFRVCTFSFDEIGSIPEEIKTIPHDEIFNHTYLEFLQNGSWIPIDATWDEKLAGYFGISHWDGKSTTGIAVKPINVYSPEESAQIIEDYNRERTRLVREGLVMNKAFFKAFNQWLDGIRERKQQEWNDRKEKRRKKRLGLDYSQTNH